MHICVWLCLIFVNPESIVLQYLLFVFNYISLPQSLFCTIFCCLILARFCEKKKIKFTHAHHNWSMSLIYNIQPDASVRVFFCDNPKFPLFSKPPNSHTHMQETYNFLFNYIYCTDGVLKPRDLRSLLLRRRP